MDHRKEAKALVSNGGDTANVYEYTPDELNHLIDPKNAYVLEAMGGPVGLAKVLNTDLENGLAAVSASEAELKQREKVYGCNKLPDRKSQSFWSIVWATLNDKVLIILIVAAVISLALGLYETLGQPPEFDPEGRQEPQVDWVEGVAILVAVVTVTFVGSLNDWQKERQFAKLNKRKDDRMVLVIRQGMECQISVHDVQVGDILMVQPGDILPVDGVVIKSFELQCDESSATGESDTLKKISGFDTLKLLQSESSANMEPHHKKLDCFMLSGAKVLGGTGSYMATAVGTNSMFGRTLSSLQTENEMTPLQEKLNRIADGIAKFGVGSAVLLFLVLFIRFLVNISPGGIDHMNTSSVKGSKFMDIFIVAVTIVVVAVPEGLPLAVTLALAFATTRMIKDNNLVRVLKSCETMSGATTVCSDKTGTLTTNKMTVVAATCQDKSWSEEEEHPEAHGSEICQGLEDVLTESIVVNSSAFEDLDDPNVLLGPKTETALLQFARSALNLKVGQLKEYRQKHETLVILPFDSARKYMLVAIPLPNGGIRVLVKGASEIVLSHCSKMVGANTEIVALDTEAITVTIDNYANASLRTIIAAYRDYTAEEAAAANLMGLSAGDYPMEDLTMLALFGIQDPLRPGVREAVSQCRRAGVTVRMVTGDNARTAKAIALNAGIVSEGDNSICMEGPDFRKLTDSQMMEVVPRLMVLARSSPQDKSTLVAFLKKSGETVAVTGDGTNDAPALKLADVGFSMGISGTEVAKEASDIIIMDDNFASIVNAIKWGRTVNDSVKKFLQFQLTVNITAVVLTFVSAVASRENESVLSAVQLLWVNLIMDTLAALALATDPPSESVLDRPPDNRSKSLITPTMWKIIFGESIFQLIVTLTLHFAGEKIWKLPPMHDSRLDTQFAAMVFNAFVWCQFFKLFVSRRLDNKQNIFEGLWKNWVFILIALIIGGFQVLIMYVGGAAFSIREQTGVQWAVAIVCGIISIPVGCLLRLIPDEFLVRYFPHTAFKYMMEGLHMMMTGLGMLFYPVTWLFRSLWHVILLCCGKKPESSTETEDEEKAVYEKDEPKTNDIEYEWMPPIQKSVDQLKFMRRIHGGRVSRDPQIWSERIPWMHRASKKNHEGTSDYSSTSFAAFMAPVVVSGAIGGWNPTVKKPEPSSK